MSDKNYEDLYYRVVRLSAIAIKKLKTRKNELEKLIRDLHKDNLRGNHKTPEDDIFCLNDALLSSRMDSAEREKDLENKEKELRELQISFCKVRDGAREACARLRKKLSDNTGIKNKRAELASCLWCKTTVINPNSDNCPACGNELYPVSRIVDGFILVKNEYFLKSTPHQRKTKQ